MSKSPALGGLLPRPMFDLLVSCAWRDDERVLRRLLCWLVFLGWNAGAIGDLLRSADDEATPLRSTVILGGLDASVEEATAAVFDGYRQDVIRQPDGTWQVLKDPVWKEPELPRLSSAQTEEYLSGIAGAVDREVWAGQAGHTDRAVLQAMLSIAVEFGTFTPACAVSALGDRANASDNTVRRALRRLAEKGWHRPVAEPLGGKARRYLLMVPTDGAKLEGYFCIGTSRDTELPRKPGTLPPSHPALSKPAHRLLQVLLEAGSFETKADWQRAANMPRRSFFRALNELKSDDLLNEDGRRCVSLTPEVLLDRLDIVAEASGAAARAAARRKAWVAKSELYGRSGRRARKASRWTTWRPSTADGPSTPRGRRSTSPASWTAGGTPERRRPIRSRHRTAGRTLLPWRPRRNRPSSRCWATRRNGSTPSPLSAARS
jgi:DNA-binding IclR family transcriptional regulator